MVNQPTSAVDPKLTEGVAYFENLLQVMPESRTALEFLCVAYEQLGEDDKSRHALVSLVSVLLSEGDIDSAELLIDRLNDYPDADAQAAILRIHSARAAINAPKVQKSAVAATTVKAELKSSDDRGTAIAAESRLVQTLRLNKIIDDTLADTLVQRLDEFASAPGTLLISALALLDKENPTLAETAAAFVADTASVTPIPAEIFDCASLLNRLPAQLVRVRGVLPIARIGDTLLVALLNPLDTALRTEVEKAAGSPCIFYLAYPRTVEELLDHLFADSTVQPEAAT